MTSVSSTPYANRAERRNEQFGRAPRGNYQRPLAKNVANVARAFGQRPVELPAFTREHEYQAACINMEVARGP